MKGHGTWGNVRPPVAGVVGRESGEIRLEFCQHSDRDALQPFVEERTRDTATVYTDRGAWQAYERLPESWRAYASVCHTPGQRGWARDDDGDGVPEVHCNTIEGVWTGPRNFNRPLRRVNKDYLDQYVAVFQVRYITKAITPALLRAMMPACTSEAT